MAKRIRLSRVEQERQIVHDYMREHELTEVDPDELTAWAIDNNRVTEEKSSFFRQARKRLVRAIRDERRTDRQGREVSTMIAIRLKGEKTQRSLFVDLLETKPKKVHTALSQQRRSIGSWVRRHKETCDSYNDNNKFGAELPLFDYNFNKDLREKEMPTEYPESAPSDDDQSLS